MCVTGSVGKEGTRDAIEASVLFGNEGRDRLRGGQGNDTIRASDGSSDTVDCGPGRDSVAADNGDRLRGCELIHLR